MKKITFLLLLFWLFIRAVPETKFPQVEISNGLIKAVLYLPDTANGYYRATRFDWSGVMPKLEYKGHQFFDIWNTAPYDPKLHDAIVGPVEDFMPLGYEESKPGENFVKIGVGALKKTEERPYRFASTYEIVNGGQWTIKKKKGSDHLYTSLNGCFRLCLFIY